MVRLTAPVFYHKVRNTGQSRAKSMQQSLLVQVCKMHLQGLNLKQENGLVQARKLHQQGSNLKQTHLLEQGYPSMPLKFNIKWHPQLRRPSRLSFHRLSVHLYHPLIHSLPDINPQETSRSPPSRNQNLFGNSSWLAM